MWQKNKRLNVKRYTYMLQHQFAKEVNGVKRYTDLSSYVS